METFLSVILMEWNQLSSDIEATIAMLCAEVDIVLLWENALELQLSELNDLAELYFSGKITVEHLTALMAAISDDRLYFKRKGVKIVTDVN
ncbi:MAG: hypothetical protein R3E08_11100 [Thiotrichaceae bacterium]